MRILFIFMALFLSSVAKAEVCTNSTGNQYINLPSDISIPADLPTGGIIGEYSGTRVSVVPCSSTQGITQDIVQSVALSIGIGKRIGKDWVVNLSNNEGVGYAFAGIVDGCGSSDWHSDGSSGSTATTICQKTNGTIGNTVYFTPKLRLYKTAPMGYSSTISPTEVGYVNRIVNGKYYTGQSFYITGTNIVTKACTVSSTLVNVNMSSVDKSRFKGVGAAAEEISDFNISLNCSRSANVSLSLGGVLVRDASNGLLSIVDQTGGAKGVAVQILQNNQVFKLNSTNAIGQTKNGNYLIPLQARYYQVGDITPGIAESLATFTVTYQ